MVRVRPLAIDLFCGLFGWSEGLVAEGYDVIGVDIEDMCEQFGMVRPDNTQLILQDVRTLHGAQFKDVALIVASPPCQKYSYMAMPWKRAKAEAAAIRADTTGEKLAALNDLFNQCFRIQREASFAAGKHIPLIVENVRGAQPWVGRARFNYGSFYLWGDVPALMPSVNRYGAGPGTKRPGRTMCFPEGSANPEAVKGRSGKLHWQDEGSKVLGFRFDGSGRSLKTASVEHTGVKVPGMNWSDPTLRGQDFTRIAGRQAMQCDCQYPEPDNNETAYVSESCPIHNLHPDNSYHESDGIKMPSYGSNRTAIGKGARFTSRDCGVEGIKQSGISGTRDNGKGDRWFQDGAARSGSKSNARKMASAMIAKIPLILSRHIAATFRPVTT